jgi:hypothetical protein
MSGGFSSWKSRRARKRVFQQTVQPPEVLFRILSAGEAPTLQSYSE